MHGLACIYVQVQTILVSKGSFNLSQAFFFFFLKKKKKKKQLDFSESAHVVRESSVCWPEQDRAVAGISLKEHVYPGHLVTG